MGGGKTPQADYMGIGAAAKAQQAQIGQMASMMVQKLQGESYGSGYQGFGNPGLPDTSQRGIQNDPSTTSLGFPGGPQTGEFDVSNPDVDAAQNDSRVSGDRGPHTSLVTQDDDSDDNLG